MKKKTKIIIAFVIVVFMSVCIALLFGCQEHSSESEEKGISSKTRSVDSEETVDIFKITITLDSSIASDTVKFIVNESYRKFNSIGNGVYEREQRGEVESIRIKRKSEEDGLYWGADSLFTYDVHKVGTIPRSEILIGTHGLPVTKCEKKKGNK
jgi:ABC-type oligopeptide transport system substrate-binding subunit